MSSSSCRPATTGTSYGEGVAAAAAGRALRWPVGSEGRIHQQLGPGASLVLAHMQAYVIQPQIRTLIEPLISVRFARLRCGLWLKSTN